MADLVSVSDAAHSLNLSSTRVRLLAATGDLPAEKIGGRWLVEKVGVERRRRRGSSGGRPFIPRNAWAVLCLASGEEVDAIDAATRSRLRRTLSLEGLDALSLRLGRRADVARYRAHPGEIAHLRADDRLSASGVSAARLVELDLLAGREVDGYVQHSTLDELVKEHALVPAAIGESNVVLRIVPDDIWDLFLAGRPHAPEAAIALDLVEGNDSRSRAAGQKLLKRLDRKVRWTP